MDRLEKIFLNRKLSGYMQIFSFIFILLTMMSDILYFFSSPYSIFFIFFASIHFFLIIFMIFLLTKIFNTPFNWLIYSFGYEYELNNPTSKNIKEIEEWLVENKIRYYNMYGKFYFISKKGYIACKLKD